MTGPPGVEDANTSGVEDTNTSGIADTNASGIADTNASGVGAQIRSRLATLRPASLELLDESAAHIGHAGARPEGQTHWRLHIVSPAFEGKSAVARHRLVYAALGELMQHPIHALALQAETPDEALHPKKGR